MYEKPDSQTAVASKVIALSDRDLKDAARLLALILDSAPGPERFEKTPATFDRHVLFRRASRALHERKKRANLFNPSLFGEPAWDVLLTLYIADYAGPRMNIARLTEHSGISGTTALRWLSSLEAQQLVRRDLDPRDSRAIVVELTEKGRGQLDLYFSETLNSGQ